MFVIFIFVMSSILKRVVSTPIAQDSFEEEFQRTCDLPTRLGTTGNPKFIEDCQTLSFFGTVPVPAPGHQQYGVHPVVCCPRKVDDEALCFPLRSINPTNVIPGCPTNEELSESQKELVQEEREERSRNQFVLRDGAQFCGPRETCTTVARCGLLNEVYPSDVGPCGFSEKESESLVCCPRDNILDEAQQKPNPRFLKEGKPYPCEDKTEYCKKWKSNGACLLNETFFPSAAEPGFIVTSPDMFSFMLETCMETCGHCGSKGCVDDHVKCPEWARSGQCYEGHAPFITALTCRESCGLCGFLSPFNTDIQVVEGKSYTKYNDRTFDCGRSEDLTVLDKKFSRNQAKIEELVVGEVVNLREADKLNEKVEPIDPKFDEGDDDDLEEVSFANSNSNATINCAATIISDRWMITAAHCYDEISGGDEPASIRVQTLRHSFTEISEAIEVRNIYVYPEYEVGSLYNDVALLELGRRVQFDFETFGDTPACIDTGLELDGKLANLQGFGLTETGEKGELLETNVTLINNKDCTAQLSKYLSTRKRKQELFCRIFEYGILDSLVCANGIENEEGVLSGACKGDSGGPVEYLQGEEKLRYLIGIISGSLSCSGKAPEWFTRVSYFREWIDCITTAGPEHNFSKEEVEKVCASSVIQGKQRKKPEFCNL